MTSILEQSLNPSAAKYLKTNIPGFKLNTKIDQGFTEVPIRDFKIGSTHYNTSYPVLPGQGFSSMETPTPSAAIHRPIPGYKVNEGRNDEYTSKNDDYISQSEWNQYLENARIMQLLGYDVEFDSEGNIIYTKQQEAEESSYYGISPYDEYNTGLSSHNAVYESDYLRLQQQQNQGYNQYNDWKPQRNSYYSQYYSEYPNQYDNYLYNGQRYNQYSGYNQYRNNGYYNNYTRYNQGYRRQYNYGRSDWNANRYNSRERGW